MQTDILSCTALSGVSHWPNPTDYSHKFSLSLRFLWWLASSANYPKHIKTAGASTRCSTREKSHTDVHMESDTRNSDILQVLLLHRGEAGKFAIPTTTKFYTGSQAAVMPPLSPCNSWRYIIAESLLYDAESHNYKQVDKLKAHSIYTPTDFFFFLTNKRLLLLNFYHTWLY